MQSLEQLYLDSNPELCDALPSEWSAGAPTAPRLIDTTETGGSRLGKVRAG